VQFLIALVLVAAVPGAGSAKSVLPVPLSLAYFGETLSHPGAIVGTELGLASDDRHALLVTLNVGSYLHLKNHVGVFASSELAYRLTLPVGLVLEAMIGLGYLHTFLQGALYAADATGAVHAVTDVGRPAFMPTASLGVGLDLAQKQGPPLTAFVRLTGFGQYPFNERMLPHAAVQVGVRLR
jgi:hypothetical protein